MTEPTFYFDYNSPYAYLAASRVDAVLPQRPRWVPIAFAFVLAAHERVPWSLREESREPGMRECERRAREYGLAPLRWPPGWPTGSYSLSALRAAILADRAGLLREFSRAAFERNFVSGAGLRGEDGIAAVARAVGLDPEPLLAAVELPETKAELKANTEAALRSGVIGVPTVAVGTELFWGDDLLEAAAAACAGIDRDEPASVAPSGPS